MKNIPVFHAGDFITVQKTITREDAATNYGTGKLSDLLATPTLVALMIEGCTRLIDDKLDEELVSVGKTISITHEAPTKIGETVTCKISVVEQIDNKIALLMEAYDEHGLIGTGKADRYIVSSAVLAEKAKQRTIQMPNV